MNTGSEAVADDDLEWAANYPVVWGRYAKHRSNPLTIAEIAELPEEPGSSLTGLQWLAISYYQPPRNATAEALDALGMFLLNHWLNEDHRRYPSTVELDRYRVILRSNRP